VCPVFENGPRIVWRPFWHADSKRPPDDARIVWQNGSRIVFMAVLRRRRARSGGRPAKFSDMASETMRGPFSETARASSWRPFRKLAKPASEIAGRNSNVKAGRNLNVTAVLRCAHAFLKLLSRLYQDCMRFERVFRTLCGFARLTMDATELTPGREIEVLWAIGDRARKRKVWWSATISSVTRSRNGTFLPKSAKIIYSARLGHAATEAAVTFLSAQELEGVGEGARTSVHLWRWAALRCAEASAPSAASPQSSRSGAGSAADLCVQGEAHRGSSSAAACAQQKLQHADLARGIDALEAHLREIRVATAPPLPRPLLFARHRLGKEISKNIPGTASALRKYRDCHTVSQDYLSVTVDCSLRDFEDICDRASECSSAETRFYPRRPPASSFTVPPVYRVSFASYAGLCAVMGLHCLEDIAETIVRMRQDTQSGAPVALRIVGFLSQSEHHPDGPMFLAVAASLSAGIRSPEPVKVLYRQSMV
jgi:hypothetical protein